MRYHEDASSLFAYLGGLERLDTVLFESADITTKSGVNSHAVLASSLRITCTGQRVRVTPLSDSGRVIATQLASQLEDYLVAAPNDSVDAAQTSDLEFAFPRSTAADERERLAAASTATVLRALTTGAGYADEAGVLPMLAGGFAFDYIDTFEDLPSVGEGINTYPDFQFVLAEVLLSINHEDRTAEVVGVDATGQPDALRARLADIADRIDSAETDGADAYRSTATPGGTVTVRAQLDDAGYRNVVETLKGNITQGDIYQVVPARTFTVPCVDSFAAYRELRHANPSPYMFYARGLDRGGQVYELFGASPESNLKYDAASRTVQLYPIAGTRPRGLHPDGSIDDELDVRMELELRTDSKEIAEHTMLVDLARNDVARVSAPGTRRVAQLLHVDRYSRVMHLVSRVTATLDEGLDALDAYRACMNMGTLTGAPKLKAVELLREAEGERRGSYGGAIGYLRGDGSMDNCIVIRSAYVTCGVAAVQAGAGVVRDSVPQSEADETLNKAYAVLAAIASAAGAELEVLR